MAGIRLGWSSVATCNRTIAKAQRLHRRLVRSAPNTTTIRAHGLDRLRGSGVLSSAALVVNATSIGLTAGEFLPLEYAATPADCLFYDLIYAREPTPFLKPAAALGRRAPRGPGIPPNNGRLAFLPFY